MGRVNVAARRLGHRTPGVSHRRSGCASAGGLFPDLEMFIEYNSTDNDAGIHVFLDGNAWKRLVIRRSGNEILEIEAERGPFKNTGLAPPPSGPPDSGTLAERLGGTLNAVAGWEYNEVLIREPMARLIRLGGGMVCN